MSELNDWKILPQNLPLVGWDLGLHFHILVCAWLVWTLVGLDIRLHQRVQILVCTKEHGCWSTPVGTVCSPHKRERADCGPHWDYCCQYHSKHLPMQLMIILTSQNHGGGLSCWIGVTIGYNPYYYDMVEAKNYFRLDYTSTLYIYKEFNHIPMQWMVIWMHPYFIKAMEVDWAGWIWLTLYKKYHYKYDMAWQKPLQIGLHFHLIYI